MEINKINKTIHQNCDMHKHAMSHLQNEQKAVDAYFQQSSFLINHFESFLQEANIDTSKKTILDFACGYGRFTRYFVQMFKETTSSDLELDMINFNKDVLHTTHTWQSSLDIIEIKKHAKKYDFVFIFSLFTHLNKEIWGDWFKALFNLTEEGGFFFISTHGYDLFSKLNPELFGDPEKCKEDFVFIPVNETTGRLPSNTYGTNIINESFINTITSPIKNLKQVKKYSMGQFDMYHTIYIFQKTE